MTALPTFPCSSKGCTQVTPFLEVLETASSSVPAENEIHFTCAACGQENTIWLDEGKVRGSSAPAPTNVANLRVYVDTTYGIDCLYQGRMYHMPKRRDVG
jgi:hypothetical protein